MDEIVQQVAEMIRDGHEPAAIIMSPWQLRRFLNECGRGPDLHYSEAEEGSGWAFSGLTIWRSREIGGPTVVSRDVFHALRRRGRWGASPAMKEALSALDEVRTDWTPLLF